jgi:predicted nucleic-acid-binding Zn-ribbon protein
MAYGKDTCSSCGKYTEITAKVLEDAEMLCKQCQDKELKIVLENFNQINFYCIKCGSSNVSKDDVKTGISLTDVPNAFYVNTFLTCGDCKARFYINMEDQGKK